MTSRSGNILTFYGDLPAFSSRSDRRCLSRPDAFDHATEIVVGNRLPVLAHRDDSLVHLRDFVHGECEADDFAAPLHGVPPRMAAEDELLRRLSHILGPHDFV